MTAAGKRMRAWYLGSDRTVLVIDRFGRPINPEEAAAVVERITAKGVFSDVLIFADEVYIPVVDDPDPEESGVRLHPDEIDAIDRLYHSTEGVTGEVFRNVDMNVLRLLLRRASEARA